MKYLSVAIIFISSFLQLTGQEIELSGQIKIINGSEGKGKILTSDSLGVATWVDPSTIAYPVTPNYLYKSATNLCADNRDWINYQKPLIDSTQVVVGGIDLSLTNSFIAWAKVEKIREDRMSIFCNSGIDAFNFLVLEEGVHTIDGKIVQAGRAENLAQTGTVTFNQPFASPPVVYVMLDQTSALTGSTILNVWNSSGVTNTMFQIWKNGGGLDDVFWVAMEEGTYTTEKWNWYATRESISSGNPTYDFPLDFFSRTPDGFGSLEGSGSTCRLKDTDKTSATFNISAIGTSHLHLLFWEENF